MSEKSDDTFFTLESIRRGLWSGVTGLLGMLNCGVKFDNNACEDADSTRICRIFPPSAPGDVVGDVTEDGVGVGLATLDIEYSLSLSLFFYECLFGVAFCFLFSFFFLFSFEFRLYCLFFPCILFKL